MFWRSFALDSKLMLSRGNVFGNLSQLPPPDLWLALSMEVTEPAPQYHFRCLPFRCTFVWCWITRQASVHSMVWYSRGSHFFPWGFFILSFQRLPIQIALMMRHLPGISSKRTLREAATSVSRTSNRQSLDEEKLKLLNKVKKASTFSFSSCRCLFVHVNPFYVLGSSSLWNLSVVLKNTYYKRNLNLVNTVGREWTLVGLEGTPIPGRG